MHNLEDEILKLNLKKGVIKEDMENNYLRVKRAFSPSHIVGEVLGIAPTRLGNHKFLNVLKGGIIAFSTIRGGIGIFNKAKNIFSGKKRRGKGDKSEEIQDY
jgi:hypothetical protein